MDNPLHGPADGVTTDRHFAVEKVVGPGPSRSVNQDIYWNRGGADGKVIDLFGVIPMVCEGGKSKQSHVHGFNRVRCIC